MRRVLGFGLALATAVTPGGTRAVYADPVAPQVAPIHLQREDAQRLRDAQRGLDGPNDAPPVPAPAALPPLATPEVPPPPPPRGTTEMTSVRAEHITGGLLIGLAGATALVSLGYLAASAVPSYDVNGQKVENDDGSIGLVFLVVSVTAGITGTILLTRQPKLRVTPVATPTSVGLALTGRL